MNVTKAHDPNYTTTDRRKRDRRNQKNRGWERGFFWTLTNHSDQFALHWDRSKIPIIVPQILYLVLDREMSGPRHPACGRWSTTGRTAGNTALPHLWGRAAEFFVCICQTNFGRFNFFVQSITVDTTVSTVYCKTYHLRAQWHSTWSPKKLGGHYCNKASLVERSNNILGLLRMTRFRWEPVDMVRGFRHCGGMILACVDLPDARMM